MLTVYSPENNHKHEEPVKVPENAQSFGFRFEGGRLWVHVNGVEVLTAHPAGRDCSFEVNSR